MTRDARREQILSAATKAFAAGGYAGTTTDEVAQAAGVSQPYVVRLFGSKEKLFRAVFDDVSGQILKVFEAIEPGPDAKAEMAHAYAALVADPDRLRVLLHGFNHGADPVVGARARYVLARGFELYRTRTGGTAEEARDFVAYGMLINVLLAVQGQWHLGEDEGFDALVTTCIALHPTH
jgi:AcrR family transcriptional regulator